MALDIVLLFGKDKKNVWNWRVHSSFFGGFSIRQLIKAIIFFMGNKSENYSSQFFACSFMHVWSFLLCLSNAKSPHDYLALQMKNPRRKWWWWQLCFQAKTKSCEIIKHVKFKSKISGKQIEFFLKEEKHLYILAFRCIPTFLLNYWGAFFSSY